MTKREFKAPFNFCANQDVFDSTGLYLGIITSYGEFRPDAELGLSIKQAKELEDRLRDNLMDQYNGDEDSNWTPDEFEHQPDLMRFIGVCCDCE